MTTQRPKTGNSTADKELEKAEKNFEAFDQSIKDMTMDRLNSAPKQETEMQTKMSHREMLNVKDHYLKPHRSIAPPKEKFNENYRDQYNHMKVYVPFIAENNELKGETIELWTKPFAGMPAEEWRVPTGKPVWGPRYLAEQIKRKYYHRLKMDESNMTGSDGRAQYYGTMAADTTIQRLDAHPVNHQKKSIFMGAEET